MSIKKIAVVTLVALAIAAWFYLDLGSYLQFDTLQAAGGGAAGLVR